MGKHKPIEKKSKPADVAVELDGEPISKRISESTVRYLSQSEQGREHLKKIGIQPVDV